MIGSIVIPQFITKVKISKSRRAKYFRLSKNKWKPRDLPRRHYAKLENGEYYINQKGYLVDAITKKKIISNPNSVGKPRYEILSGNKFKSGYNSPFIRAKLVSELKNFYRPHVQKWVKENGPITTFPLRIEWDVYTTVEENPSWDADNLEFYYKYFQDSLHESEDDKGNQIIQTIPEDNVKYIIFPPGPKIIPIDNWDDRKFEFRFYHDDRKELNRKPWI